MPYGRGGDVADYAVARDRSMMDAFQFAIQMIMANRQAKAKQGLDERDLGLRERAFEQGLTESERNYELEKKRTNSLSRYYRAQERNWNRPAEPTLSDLDKKTKWLIEHDIPLDSNEAKKLLGTYIAPKIPSGSSGKATTGDPNQKNKLTFINSSVSKIDTKIANAERAVKNIDPNSKAQGDLAARAEADLKVGRLNKVREKLVNAAGRLSAGESIGGGQWKMIERMTSDPIGYQMGAEEQAKQTRAGAGMPQVAPKQDALSYAAQYPIAPPNAKDGDKVRSKKTGEIRIVKNGRLYPIGE